MLTMNIEFILEFDCSFYARCSLCTSALPNLAMQVAKVLRYVLVKASWYYLTCQVKKVNFMHTGVCVETWQCSKRIWLMSRYTELQGRDVIEKAMG